MATERVERRLTAILAADVAGYSRLMGADEEGTLTQLKAHRRALVDPKITEHRGRIVKTTGDGMLVEFASVVDAVRCAVEVQRAMAERNAEVPQDKRIEFRVGINVGDIIIDGGDIFGDGVNVAARLEGLAEPGGICVSSRVQEDARGKFDVAFEDVGEQALKNIERPVRVYRIRVGAPASQRPGPTLPDKPSIAVLPFQNMSGDPEQDYFCDGMVEDLITGLSRIKWFFVIARNSSFAYKGKSPDIRQVGRELGVRYVLEGSVRKAGNRVRITGQLVEAKTGRHIWAERYDRPLDDIFAVQDEITSSVTGAIEPSLRQAEIERVKRKRPDSLDAYDLVLQGYSFITGMPEGATKALPFLERALTIEPDYATAHGYAAFCHQNLFVRGGMHDENREGAIRHAHAAIAYGRDDATALAMAGLAIGMVEHDSATAIGAFEAAMAISPSYSMAYNLGSVVVGWAGEAERAIEWGETALRLSPLDPWNFVAWLSISLAHFQRRRYEEAVNAARKGIHCNAVFSVNYMALAAALAMLGKTADAKATIVRLLSIQPGFTIARHCAAVGAVPALSQPLHDAMRKAGLPE